MRTPRLDHPLPATSRTARRLGLLAAVALGCVVMAACQSAPPQRPVALAPQVDLQRFMGSWYVIGNIPTPPERQAYDAVEHYALRDDGRIATTFTYRDGGFEQPVKTMTPVGTVVDRRSNAVWTMQFLWPFQADYRIMRIDPDYRHVVVGRDKRDYVWIMSRTPTMDEPTYRQLVSFVAAQGYDTGKLRRVPQTPKP